MNRDLAHVINSGRRGSFFEEEKDAWSDPVKHGALKDEEQCYSPSEASRQKREQHDRIHGWADVKAALALVSARPQPSGDCFELNKLISACPSQTWRNQRWNLFTAWVHAPIGICFMLLITWGFHLAIDAAPFNFPAALMTMMALFLFLLALDGLSLLFPGSSPSPPSNETDYEKDVDLDLPSDDEEADADDAPKQERRRFLDPLMRFIAPPCDFLLRNMSVLFTTSFVMLPARDKLPAKEIGLIIAWFITTEILALLFPIGFNVGTSWAIKHTKRALKKEKKADLESGQHTRPSLDSQETAVPRPPPNGGMTSGDMAQYRGNALETARQQGEFAGRDSIQSPGWGRTSRDLRSGSSRPAALNLNHHTPRSTPVFRPPTPKTAREDLEISRALEPSAVERLSNKMAASITPVVYLTMFFVGSPLYYFANFPLILFIAVNVLNYMISIKIVPAVLRQVLHPIITSSCLTMLALWALGATKGMNMISTLQLYNEGNARYTDLLNPKGYHGPVPGAGDVFASILDAGIVALALPMYRYRYDLRANVFRVMLALFPCCALALFAWPVLGKLIGLRQVDALTFSARFLSSPLAVELARNVDADESLVTVLVTFTGLTIAIIKDPLFKLLRIPEKDVLTWGVTVGSTAGAIGTGSLVSKPRAMAISSLTFVLFGTMLLLIVAFQPVVDLMQRLTGGPVSIAMSVGLGTKS